MDVAAELMIPKVRCAPFHESMHVDPIGSAGAYDAFLCIEVPLPWERDISMNEPFPSVIDQVGAATTGPDGRRWRPQGLVADPGDHSGSAGPTGSVRVTAYEQAVDLGGAAPFGRREWLVAPENVVELGRALIHADGSAVRSFDDLVVDVDASVLDVFVCTHGKRDSCCGNLGTGLFTELSAAYRSDNHTHAGGVRIRRVSHTGGHRFAPTALTFPDGYAWAHLDRGVADEVILRTGDVGVAASHCRGFSSFAGGPAQAADRAALVEVGWQWTRARRTVTVVAFDRLTMTTTVRIDGSLARVAIDAGDAWSFEVRVEIERHVPTITCGTIEGPEYAVEPVWRVTGVRALPDAQRPRTP